MKLNFKQEVLVLPASLLTHCSEADAATMRVLLWLASDLSLAEKPKQLAKLADCDAKVVKAALQFWQFRDVLVKDEEDEVSPPTVKKEKKTAVEAPTAPEKRTLVERADEMPVYTSNEIASLLESRASMRLLIDEAQRVMGKMFNTSDVNIIVGMRDYLGLEEESILLLLAHCKRVGKTSMRAVEKYAFSLCDKGITTPEALDEAIRTAEAMHTFEGEVRALFGMKSRALTSKESKMLSAWLSFGYGIDVVRLAYEMTVTATNAPSVPYANAILERWNADGLHTLEEIQAALDAEQEKKAGKGDFGSTFDTDDFFEAALRRGLNERRS
ncbi:MAG: DnaD domain protein [Ruminococcaceae bacterium]|nr:DnaD domain protein [Oscillospiraceae bacterium]